MRGGPSVSESRGGAPSRAATAATAAGPFASAAAAATAAVRNDYKSERAVALHEVSSLPPGREVYVQLGGVFRLADAATAKSKLQQQQQQQQQQQP